MAMSFSAQLPRQIPNAVTVYRLRAPQVSNALLIATARKLGLTGKGSDFIASEDTLAYGEGRFQLEMHRLSGALSFVHRDRYGMETEEAFELSDPRAGAIARRFIQKAALFPMANARLERVTHLRGASADVETRTVTAKVVDAGVVYSRVVDKISVSGPGGLCMVHIDPGGEVVGLRSVWRPLGKRLARVKIKPIDEALEGLRKLADGMRGDTTVVKATFGYFELGALDSQKVLEPAFAFVYVVHDGEVATKSAHVVHAGDKTFGTLLGRKRFPTEPQKGRRQ